jgi:hypothetical protein
MKDPTLHFTRSNENWETNYRILQKFFSIKILYALSRLHFFHLSASLGLFDVSALSVDT